MRILLVHNYYQQPGGEDVVFAAERDLLRARGHDVHTFTDHNDRIRSMRSTTLAVDTIWSRTNFAAVRAALRRTNAQVMHVHNTFPLLSPAVYAAAAAEKVPVVQTLHNYRLVCPAATLFRMGAPCRACMDAALPWPAVRHACYQANRIRSFGVVSMLLLHRMRGTWSRAVTRYVVMSRFARDLFIEAGIPDDRLVVKPHFVAPDPGVGAGDGGYVLYVGRLDAPKGVETLCRAWQAIDDLPLKIVGDGPLSGRVKALVGAKDNVQVLGHRQRDEVAELMGRASLLVVPSEWYEPFGLVIVESFARGTPVLASAIGPLTELVEDGVNGATFTAGEPTDLATQARRLLSRPERLLPLRDVARRSYLTRYTADRNYQQLMAVYDEAIGVSRAQP